MSIENRIPNIGREYRGDRDKDFIPLNELKAIDEAVDKAIAKVQALDLTYKDLDNKKDAQNVMQELQVIMFNLADAIDEQGNLLKSTTVANSVTNEVGGPLRGPYAIPSAIDAKLNELYALYTKIVGSGSDKNEWRYDLEAYFEKVYKKFQNMVNAIFGKSLNTNIIEAKNDDSKDYIKTQSVDFNKKALLALDPDYTAYPRSINILLSNADEDVVICEVDELIENNLALNFKFFNGKNYFDYNVVVDNGKLFIHNNLSMKYSDDSYKFKIFKSKNTAGKNSYLFTMSSNNGDSTVEYGFEIIGLLVGAYRFTGSGFKAELHKDFYKYYEIKDNSAEPNYNETYYTFDNISFEGASEADEGYMKKVPKSHTNLLKFNSDDIYYTRRENLEQIKCIEIGAEHDEGTVNANYKDIDGNNGLNLDLPMVVDQKQYKDKLHLVNVDVESAELFSDKVVSTETILKNKKIFRRDTGVKFMSRLGGRIYSTHANGLAGRPIDGKLSFAIGNKFARFVNLNPGDTAHIPYFGHNNDEEIVSVVDAKVDYLNDGNDTMSAAEMFELPEYGLTFFANTIFTTTKMDPETFDSTINGTNTFVEVPGDVFFTKDHKVYNRVLENTYLYPVDWSFANIPHEPTVFDVDGKVIEEKHVIPVSAFFKVITWKGNKRLVFATSCVNNEDKVTIWISKPNKFDEFQELTTVDKRHSYTTSQTDFNHKQECFQVEVFEDELMIVDPKKILSVNYIDAEVEHPEITDENQPAPRAPFTTVFEAPANENIEEIVEFLGTKFIRTSSDVYNNFNYGSIYIEGLKHVVGEPYEEEYEETTQNPILDELGNQKYDDNGNPLFEDITETKTRTVTPEWDEREFTKFSTDLRSLNRPFAIHEDYSDKAASAIIAYCGGPSAGYGGIWTITFNTTTNKFVYTRRYIDRSARKIWKFDNNVVLTSNYTWATGGLWCTTDYGVTQWSHPLWGMNMGRMYKMMNPNYNPSLTSGWNSYKYLLISMSDGNGWNIGRIYFSYPEQNWWNCSMGYNGVHGGQNFKLLENGMWLIPSAEPYARWYGYNWNHGYEATANGKSGWCLFSEGYYINDIDSFRVYDNDTTIAAEIFNKNDKISEKNPMPYRLRYIAISGSGVNTTMDGIWISNGWGVGFRKVLQFNKITKLTSFVQSDSGELFVSYNNSNTDGGIYRSTDWGEHWELVLSGVGITKLANLNGVLVAASDNNDRGSFYAATDSTGKLWKAIDKSGPYNGLFGVYDGRILISSEANSGTNGVVFTTNDNGRSWESVSDQGAANFLKTSDNHVYLTPKLPAIHYTARLDDYFEEVPLTESSPIINGEVRDDDGTRSLLRDHVLSATGRFPKELVDFIRTSDCYVKYIKRATIAGRKYIFIDFNSDVLIDMDDHILNDLSIFYFDEENHYWTPATENNPLEYASRLVKVNGDYYLVTSSIISKFVESEYSADIFNKVVLKLNTVSGMWEPLKIFDYKKGESIDYVSEISSVELRFFSKDIIDVVLYPDGETNIENGQHCYVNISNNVVSLPEVMSCETDYDDGTNILSSSVDPRTDPESIFYGSENQLMRPGKIVTMATDHVLTIAADEEGKMYYTYDGKSWRGFNTHQTNVANIKPCLLYNHEDIKLWFAVSQSRKELKYSGTGFDWHNAYIDLGDDEYINKLCNTGISRLFVLTNKYVYFSADGIEFARMSGGINDPVKITETYKISLASNFGSEEEIADNTRNESYDGLLDSEFIKDPVIEGHTSPILYYKRKYNDELYRKELKDFGLNGGSVPFSTINNVFTGKDTNYKKNAPRAYFLYDTLHRENGKPTEVGIMDNISFTGKLRIKELYFGTSSASGEFESWYLKLYWLPNGITPRTEEVTVPALDEEGNPVFKEVTDAEGNLKYDDDGNLITEQVFKTEIREIPIDPEVDIPGFNPETDYIYTQATDDKWEDLLKDHTVYDYFEIDEEEIKDIKIEYTLSGYPTDDPKIEYTYKFVDKRFAYINGSTINFTDDGTFSNFTTSFGDPFSIISVNHSANPILMEPDVYENAVDLFWNRGFYTLVTDGGLYKMVDNADVSKMTSWSKANTQLSGMHSVSTFEDNRMVVAGKDKTAFSADGLNWTVVNADTAKNPFGNIEKMVITRQEAINSATVYGYHFLIADGGNTVYRSGDYGGSWAKFDYTSRPVRNICFDGDINDMLTFMCTENGILYSTDYGTTWLATNITSGRWNEVRFLNNSDKFNFVWVAVGEDHEMAWSSNGKDWQFCTGRINEQIIEINDISDHDLFLYSEKHSLQLNRFDNIISQNAIVANRYVGAVKNTSAGIMIPYGDNIVIADVKTGDKLMQQLPIMDVFETTDGIYGSLSGGGLVTFDNETQKFTTVTEYQNLSNIHVEGIVENSFGTHIYGYEESEIGEGDFHSVVYFKRTGTNEYVKALDIHGIIDCINAVRDQIIPCITDTDHPNLVFKFNEETMKYESKSIQDTNKKLSFNNVCEFEDKLVVFNGSGRSSENPDTTPNAIGFCLIFKNYDGYYEPDFGTDPHEKVSETGDVRMHNEFALWVNGDELYASRTIDHVPHIYHFVSEEDSLEWTFEEITDKYDPLVTFIRSNNLTGNIIIQKSADLTYDMVKDYTYEDLIGMNYDIAKVYFDYGSKGVITNAFIEHDHEYRLKQESIAVGTTLRTNHFNAVLALGADAKIAIFDKKFDFLKVCDVMYRVGNLNGEEVYQQLSKDDFSVISNVIMGSNLLDNTAYLIIKNRWLSYMVNDDGDKVPVYSDKISERVYKFRLSEAIKVLESGDHHIKLEEVTGFDTINTIIVKNYVKSEANAEYLNEDIEIDTRNNRQLIGYGRGYFFKNTESVIFFNLYKMCIDVVSKLNWDADFDKDLSVDVGRKYDVSNQKYFFICDVARKNAYTTSANGAKTITDGGIYEIERNKSGAIVVNKTDKVPFLEENKPIVGFKGEMMVPVGEVIENLDGTSLTVGEEKFETSKGILALSNYANMNMKNGSNTVINNDGSVEMDVFTNLGHRYYNHAKDTSYGLFRWYTPFESQVQPSEFNVDTEEYLSGWIYFTPKNSSKVITIYLGSNKSVVGVFETYAGIFISYDTYRWYGVDAVQYWALAHMIKIPTDDTRFVRIDEPEYFADKNCLEYKIVDVVDGPDGIFSVGYYNSYSSVFRYNGEDFYELRRWSAGSVGPRRLFTTEKNTFVMTNYAYDVIWKYDAATDSLISTGLACILSTWMRNDPVESVYYEGLGNVIIGRASASVIRIIDLDNLKYYDIGNIGDCSLIFKASANFKKLVAGKVTEVSGGRNFSTSTKPIADILYTRGLPLDTNMRTLGSIVYNGEIVPISGLRISSVEGQGKTPESVTFVIDKDSRFARANETVNGLMNPGGAKPVLKISNITDIDLASDVRRGEGTKMSISKINLSVIIDKDLNIA